MAGAFLFALSGIESSHGASINYGSFMGDTVTFIDVTEASNSGDAIPLFGAPTVVGDSLDFNPVGFSAQTAGAGGVDITDGQLSFMVEAKPGKIINTLNLSEAGDTTMAGVVPLNSNGTSTAVFATGILNIHEVDYIGINVLSIPISMTFTPSNGDYFLGIDGAGGPVYHTAWSGSLSVNLNSVLTANNVSFITGASKISVNLNNTLIAVSEFGTQALMAKKDFGGLNITVNEIPEPTSFALTLLALMGLAVARRSAR